VTLVEQSRTILNVRVDRKTVNWTKLEIFQTPITRVTRRAVHYKRDPFFLTNYKQHETLRGPGKQSH